VAIREADIKGQQANTEAAQSSLEKARLNLAYCQITAPVAGVITQRSAEVAPRQPSNPDAVPMPDARFFKRRAFG